VQTPIHSWLAAGISSLELVTKASRVLFHLIRNQELLMNLSCFFLPYDMTQTGDCLLYDDKVDDATAYLYDS
jgi:hypothetical protein